MTGGAQCQQMQNTINWRGKHGLLINLTPFCPCQVRKGTWMWWQTDVYSHSPKNETSSQPVKAWKKKAMLLCGWQCDSVGKAKCSTGCSQSQDIINEADLCQLQHRVMGMTGSV